MRTASIKYDFETNCWIATADWDGISTGRSIESPERAIESLRYQCDKYDRWPKK